MHAWRCAPCIPALLGAAPTYAHALPGTPQDLAHLCDADPKCKGFVYLPGGLDFKSSVGARSARRLAVSRRARCLRAWWAGAPGSARGMASQIPSAPLSPG